MQVTLLCYDLRQSNKCNSFIPRQFKAEPFLLMLWAHQRSKSLVDKHWFRLPFSRKKDFAKLLIDSVDNFKSCGL